MGRARLVVLGVEVGGRLSTATQSFLSQLATAKASGEVPLMRRRAEQTWRPSWEITFVVHSSVCGGKFDVGASGSSGC